VGTKQTQLLPAPVDVPQDAADIFGERFVCMDLDCVIGGPLDPLFDRPEDLVLFKGTAPDRPYNGS
jgi:hypothetical protein